MVQPQGNPANGFVKAMRKVYNPLGFSKGYNFVLWFILCCAMFGFIIARFPYANFWGVFCSPNPERQLSALPGECYWYTKPGRYNVGIIMHICTILPGTMLALFQFVPAIRYKAMLFHRINGYVILALSLAGTIGALMITDKAFGGSLDIQAASGLLSIGFVGSIALAYINIKRLQIDQHRAWMLRAWVYAGTILTARLILITGAIIGTRVNSNLYLGEKCAKIDFMMQNEETVLTAFPGCRSFYNGTNPDQVVAVHANFNGQNIAEMTAAFSMTFGMALWLAIAIHAILVEVYLHLTPAEAARLQQVSYERQVRAGYRHPGNAGLTAERLGDAVPFVPEKQGQSVSSEAKFEAKQETGTSSLRGDVV